MALPLPERRHLKHIADIPEEFTVHDLIGEQEDIQSIADALYADTEYNPKTGAWRLTLFKEATSQEFRPTLTLTPNPGAKPGERVKPTLTYVAAEDEEPVSVGKITRIRENPEHDNVEFQSMGRTGLTVFVLSPRGTFHHQRISTSL